MFQKYNLTKRWADYLVQNSLTPQSQYVSYPATQKSVFHHMLCRTSADGESTANMTNLAIKGIIGVKAMAEISRAVGQNTDAENYDVCRTSSYMFFSYTGRFLAFHSHRHRPSLAHGNRLRYLRTSRTSWASTTRNHRGH